MIWGKVVEGFLLVFAFKERNWKNPEILNSKM